MALLQIRTTPLGQGLPSLATLLFNHPVCSIMAVMDRKPINVDNDDKQQAKYVFILAKMTKIMIRQDSLCLSHSVNCSGSMRRWGAMDPWYNNWKGNHNHHSRSHKIQVTNTGRIVTCKRQHIKPASITREDYMCYQASKHTKTDLLDAILVHI